MRGQGFEGGARIQHEFRLSSRVAAHACGRWQQRFTFLLHAMCDCFSRRTYVYMTGELAVWNTIDNAHVKTRLQAHKLWSSEDEKKAKKQEKVLITKVSEDRGKQEDLGDEGSSTAPQSEQEILASSIRAKQAEDNPQGTSSKKLKKKKKKK